MRRWRAGRRRMLSAWLCLVAGWAAGCERDASEGRAPDDDGSPAAVEARPPFDVRGDCEGLLLRWFDDEGVHTAQRRGDIPEDRRQRVRVDSLGLAPEDRLDPDEVYVADLRAPGEDGQYRVVRMARRDFDAWVEQARSGASGTAPHEGEAAARGGDAAGDVVLYGASWCGACRGAAAFLRERGVPFVEKDIEKDPAAARELQRKGRAAGVATGSIPVIDFRGTLVQGFDRAALDRLIAQSAEPL